MPKKIASKNKNNENTTEALEPVVSMDVDPSPSKKGKEKETLNETPEIPPPLST
ncbi:15003_t:CDS:2 [Funneliformis geosporum]|nr:15003_t:CDS:2 [Funneliformis geosporum]